MNSNVVFIDYRPEPGTEPKVMDYIDEVNLAVRQPVTAAFYLLKECLESGEPLYRDEWAAALDTIWGSLERWKKLNQAFL